MSSRKLDKFATASYTGIMPLFTRENAAEMARRSVQARIAASKAPVLPPVQPDNEAEATRKQVLGVQIEMLDKHIEKAKRAEDVCKLIAAKEKLWRLLHMSDMPPNGRTGLRAPVSPIPRTTPQPIAPVPALVVPSPRENHKSEPAPAQVAA